MPLPSCPDQLPPQQATCPSVSTAHEWLVPVATAVAPDNPDTLTGLADLSSVVMSPSCPEPLLPQQAICPPATTAHEWFSPAASAVAPDTPDTSTGPWSIGSPGNTRVHPGRIRSGSPIRTPPGWTTDVDSAAISGQRYGSPSSRPATLHNVSPARTQYSERSPCAGPRVAGPAAQPFWTGFWIAATVAAGVNRPASGAGPRTVAASRTAHRAERIPITPIQDGRGHPPRDPVSTVLKAGPWRQSPRSQRPSGSRVEGPNAWVWPA